jgi:WD40 repeat protein/transcriptional regulator with XRE-family HTH domain
MTSHPGAFGERLRAYRAAARLSQEELAERSGVSVRAISDMERGRTRWPYRDSVLRLADALRLTDQEREGFLVLARRPVADSAGQKPVTVPYRGLSAFREQDAGLFFGREDATAQVLERMSAQLDGTGLMVMSGVSGAGKSSLLCAGLLPRLRQAGLAAAPEAAAWPCLAFAPGRGPLEELAVRIAPLARIDASALRQQLAADPAGFALTARQAALAATAYAGVPDTEQRRVVLAVDQCEQLFTACDSGQDREAFITALHAAATGGNDGQCPGALVVLVVRADFEARLADYPQLAPAVQDRYLLTAMTRRQLRLAITQPAAAVGSRADDDLVQVLLEETSAHTAAPPSGTATAGVLPLLSHSLDQAWRTRTGQDLTLADYERAGGIEGAVAASAQRAYQTLTPAQQQAARQVFTRLTATSPDGTDTALAVARADLTVGKDDATTRDVAAVLERFATERLLTLDTDTVAVSHEVLLTAWPMLRDDWLAAARADRATRTRLHATATEWARDSRDPSCLYSGTRLDAAAATAARIEADPRQIPLSQAERDFLHASHRAWRRRTRTRRQLIAVLLALVVALTTVWIMTVRAGQVASAQRDIAVSRLLISESGAAGDTNATVSRLDAIAAWALSPSPQARYAMVSAAASPQVATISADPAGVYVVAFSPDGKTLATGGLNGAQLWDPATGQQIGRPLRTAMDIVVVAFSPDGKTLATGGPDGAQLWDPATGQQIGKPFAIATDANLGCMGKVSPDGKTLAIESRDGIMRLWDVTTGHQIGKPLATSAGANSSCSAAFSPDGKTLAAEGGDGIMRLWDVTTGHQIGKPLATTAGANSSCSAAFSPDGKTLAIASDDGTAHLWDVTTGHQIGKSLATGAGIFSCSIAFSPGGMTLATDSPAGIRLWDVATGRQVSILLTDGSSNRITSMAFSPDGKTLAAGGPNGRARLWDVAAATVRQVGSPPAGPASPIAWAGFSPDGKTLATTRGDGTAQLWNAATSHQIGKPLPPGRNGADALAFTPDGKTLATGSRSGVHLSDIATGQPTGKPLAAASGDTPINAIAFSPDGKKLATVSNDGTTQLWEMATGHKIGKPLANVRYPGYYYGLYEVAFSPDGKTLAVNFMRSVTLWDIATRRQIGHLTSVVGGYLTNPILSVAFSPDGKTLAAGGPNGVQLWEAATARRAGNLMTSAASEWIDSVAFSPDGKTLAIGGPDGVHLWDVATGQQIHAQPVGAAGDLINSVAFSPDGKTLVTGGSDGTQLWNVSYLTDPLSRLCSQTEGSLTPAEWARYVPAGTPYRNACPRAGTTRAR